MGEYTYQVYLLAEESVRGGHSRMEGIVTFDNPVAEQSWVIVTLGAKKPYTVVGRVKDVQHAAIAHDVHERLSSPYSSLVVQTTISQKRLDAFHDSNGPHK